jgi:hypothetical protein
MNFSFLLAVFGFLDLGLDPDPFSGSGYGKLATTSADAVRISYVRMIELGEESGLSLKISQHIVCCLFLNRKNSKVKNAKK